MSFVESLNGVFRKITEIPWRFLFSFLHERTQNIIVNKVLEMEIVFISDRDFMTYQHYVNIQIQCLDGD